MKISDPIGKVYQHSMFKKKSYSIPKGGDNDMLDRHRTHSDEDDDDASDVSSQSDDSLSTKSSRASPARRPRTRSNSRHRRSIRDEEDPGERDREDAISYASRNERGDRHRSSSRRSTKKTPSAKKYNLDSLGPTAASYSLWTSRKSLKRDHKRKFNRSMCGVLLGVSIVLVVLGILGIIGIAVYLGVVQKIESPEKDLVSIDGAFRVMSEEFSLSLLNPASLDYKENENKFTEILEKTFRKSHLQDAFVKIVIDGFSSGSIKVFFKVILDRGKLPDKLKDDPVMATKDVMMQEVMSLDRSEFNGHIIDIDSIDFSLSKVQDVVKKYLEPEPYQGDKASTEPEPVKTNPSGGSLWQNLAQSTARSVYRTDLNEGPSQWPGAGAGPGQTATDRVDTFDTMDETHLNSNGWSLPKYPTNLMYDQGPSSNLVPRYPNIANMVTPQTPLIISPPSVRAKFPGNNFQSGLSPLSPSYPPLMSKRYPVSPDKDVSSRRGPATASSGDLMSEYMEPPPPPSPSSSESLNLETLFRNQNPSPANNLQSMSSSETSYRMTPKPQPQTQNRRIDQDDYSDRFNGFWNMLHPDRKPPNMRPGPESQFQNRMSSSKDERIMSMQDELEQLLLLESQSQGGGGGPSLYEQIQLMDDNEIQQLADQLVPLLEPQNNQNYKPPTNSWQAKPSKIPDPVSINNFGSSGLKPIKTNSNVIHGSTTTPLSTTVMDIHVPQDQDTGFFGVGSSLSFSSDDNDLIRSKMNVPNSNTIMNSVGSLNSDQLIQNSVALGSDPNIVYPQQIRAGTQMMQGPQGPIVSSPRPQSMAVQQTPLAPQLPLPGNFGNNGIISQPGSGHYNSVTSGNVHSGHQVVRNRATSRPDNGPLSSSNLVNVLAPSPLRPKQNYHQPNRVETVKTLPPNRRTGMASDRQGQSDIIGNILPAAIGLSSSAGISPIGIFSNLLNAYATIDSKHDLTGKLVNSAVSWLSPTAESRTTDVVGDVTSTPTTTPSTTKLTTPRKNRKKNKTTESSTERNNDKPMNNISVKVHDNDVDENEYQSIFDKIRAASAGNKESEYDIVTNYDTNLPPVKSNLFSDGPLRPKPPSEDIIQVSPAPHDYNNNDPALQLGVSNPYWYSNEIKASTAGYGPDDFIVETVNLDKNFFYQFFTSKPMIIDTDVVTSTSVQVKYDAKPKKGRETGADLLKSSRETLMNLPEHLIGKDILPNHILKKTGQAFGESEEEIDIVHPESEFKRYNLPAEIQVTRGTRNGKTMEPDMTADT